MKLLIKLFKIIFSDQINSVTGLIKFYAYAGLFILTSFAILILTILYNVIF